MATESNKKGAITLSRTNFSGYVGHVLNALQCLLLNAV